MCGFLLFTLHSLNFRGHVLEAPSTLSWEKRRHLQKAIQTLHRLNIDFSLRGQKEGGLNAAQNVGVFAFFFKLKRAPKSSNLTTFLSSTDSFDSSQAVDVNFYQRQKENLNGNETTLGIKPKSIKKKNTEREEKKQRPLKYSICSYGGLPSAHRERL